MSIEIEKGVPVPGRTSRRRATYPWEQMQVGDSFFVQGVNENSFRHQVCVAGKTYGMKFTVSKTDGGFRVWRVS